MYLANCVSFKEILKTQSGDSRSLSCLIYDLQKTKQGIYENQRLLIVNTDDPKLNLSL